MLDIVEKYFKTSIINFLREIKKNILKIKGACVDNNSIKNINIETKYILKNTNGNVIVE